MGDNVYTFACKQVELDCHNELLHILDRAIELTMILESASYYTADYKDAGDKIYQGFRIVEQLRSPDLA